MLDFLFQRLQDGGFQERLGFSLELEVSTSLCIWLPGSAIALLLFPKGSTMFKKKPEVIQQDLVP